MFRNDQIEPERLPDYNEPALKPVVPAFRRYVLVSTAVYWLVPLLAALAVRWVPFLADSFPFAGAWLVAGAVLLALSTLCYRWLDAGRRGWAMREHDLIAGIGILWRTVTVLPVARIQHVETSHGPLERWHGLARVKLYTAGGMTADLVLLGLEREQADQLREYLVEQIRLREQATRERVETVDPPPAKPDAGTGQQS